MGPWIVWIVLKREFWSVRAWLWRAPGSSPVTARAAFPGCARALGVSGASSQRLVTRRRAGMRKARGARKAQPLPDPHSDKKLREAPRCAEDGGAAPRARKKGYKPPDVRSIFGARGRRGEGHEFREEESEGWCDVCCAIIFQGGLMCTGKREHEATFYIHYTCSGYNPGNLLTLKPRDQ